MGNMYRTFGEIWMRMKYASRQTDRQTDKRTYIQYMLITILCTPSGGLSSGNVLDSINEVNLR